jgi:hypothetical protein
MSLLAALLLLFAVIGGCSPAGSTSVNTVLKIFPGAVNTIFVADWDMLRSDSDMQALWEKYSESMSTESMEDYLGIDADDVELMVMGATESGTGYYMVLKGKFDIEKIRPILESNGNMERQEDYLRVEIWSGEGSVAFIRDMMVIAMSVDSLKTMIRLHEGQDKDSFYNDANFNVIIDKLPAGVFTFFSSDGEYESAAAGMSFRPASADSLSFAQYYVYDDTAAAETGKADIEGTVAGYFEGTIDSVNQEKSLVEVKGSITVDDFIYSEYFMNMGF